MSKLARSYSDKHGLKDLVKDSQTMILIKIYNLMTLDDLTEKQLHLTQKCNISLKILIV